MIVRCGASSCEEAVGGGTRYFVFIPPHILVVSSGRKEANKEEKLMNISTQ